MIYCDKQEVQSWYFSIVYRNFILLTNSLWIGGTVRCVNYRLACEWGPVSLISALFQFLLPQELKQGKNPKLNSDSHDTSTQWDIDGNDSDVTANSCCCLVIVNTSQAASSNRSPLWKPQAEYETQHLGADWSARISRYPCHHNNKIYVNTEK